MENFSAAMLFPPAFARLKGMNKNSKGTGVGGGAVCPELRARLRALAARFEAPDFIDGDPLSTLRGCQAPANIEATAFVAAALSYGSRRQFIPKIEEIKTMAGGDVYGWIAGGRYAEKFKEGDASSFYRLFSHSQMASFFSAYREILLAHGSLGEYLRGQGATSGLAAVEAICAAFGGRAAPVIPKDATSPCKRICMFLRWMARGGSPVDLGLWGDWFDRRTLIMPLDVHVLAEARKLGLVRTKNATMRTARDLTSKMAEAFPDDPCRGDFALYGLGVSELEDSQGAAAQ